MSEVDEIVNNIDMLLAESKFLKEEWSKRISEAKQAKRNYENGLREAVKAKQYYEQLTQTFIQENNLGET